MWRHHTQRMTSYISVKCTGDNGKKPRVWGQCHLWEWSALGRNAAPALGRCRAGVADAARHRPSAGAEFLPHRCVGKHRADTHSDRQEWTVNARSLHPQWWRHYPYTITCVWRNADLKSPLASCVNTTQYCALRHRSVCMSVAQGSVRINYSPPSEININ